MGGEVFHIPPPPLRSPAADYRSASLTNNYFTANGRDQPTPILTLTVYRSCFLSTRSTTPITDPHVRHQRFGQPPPHRASIAAPPIISKFSTGPVVAPQYSTSQPLPTAPGTSIMLLGLSLAIIGRFDLPSCILYNSCSNTPSLFVLTSTGSYRPWSPFTSLVLPLDCSLSPICR